MIYPVCTLFAPLSLHPDLTPMAYLPRWPVIASGFVALALGGCTLLGDTTAQLHPAGVSGPDWTAPPARLTGQQVYLQGRVTAIVPLMQTQAYQLETGDRKLWVKAQDGPPLKGQERLLIRARLQQEARPAGEQDLGEVYAIEERRLRSEP